MIGTRLSHYRITARLGAGGMGEVYRAYDERLGRDVAIKVLPPELLADETARARLRREARSLSRLNHPNICTVFDYDVDGERTFMIVELLEGETLAERIRRGPLDASEIRRVGGEIAAALEAARDQGVVHRDLKPGNVMITRRGVTKVLDFGLARVEPGVASTASTESMTSEGAVVGTLPYMAPEQVRGEPTDARTDIYALGATLYEMATGQRPFVETQSLALAATILHQAPPPPRSLGSSIDAPLERVILRCLEKDPARRFQSPEEVGEALLGEAKQPSAPRRIRPRLARRARWAAVAVVLGLTAAGWLLRGGCAQGSRVIALAVLPLANLSGDASQEFFADGMTEELITMLGQVSTLRVTSRSSVMPYKRTERSLQEIAGRLGVDLLIEGSVMRSGEQVRISAKLVEAAKDRLLWSGSFDRVISDVLVLQSDVARAVVDAVKLRTTPAERSRLQTRTPMNPKAYEAYLRGRELEGRYTKESFLQAIDAYRDATSLQPAFAPAHAGIASVYLKMSSVYLDPAEAMPRAEAEAAKAVGLDSASAEALAALAYVRGFYRFDWDAAEAGLRRAIDSSPSDAAARSSYGYLLTVNGRFAEARREFRRAREIDPLSQSYAAYSLMPLYEGRAYDEAIREATEILRADPGSAFVRLIRAQSYSMKGDHAAAVEDLRAALAAERQPHFLAYLVFVLRRAGRTAEADSAEREFDTLAKTVFVQPYTQAIVSLSKGERDEALRWLERGVEMHSEEVVFLKVDPVMDPLRADPRFRVLLRRVGLGS